MQASDFLNADVISAAASSALGIVALVVLVLAFVALVFFRNDLPLVRLSVFGVLVVVFVGLIAASIYQEGIAQPNPAVPKVLPVCSQDTMNWEEYRKCMENRGN